MSIAADQFTAVLAQEGELSDACGSSRNSFCRWVFETTDNASLASAANWFLERPLRIIVIVVLAVLCRRLVRRAVQRLVQRAVSEHDKRTQAELAELANGLPDARPEHQRKHRQSDERYQQRVTTMGTALGSAGTVAISTIALLLVLGELNINLGPLLAGAGVAGLAIGFGAQTLVRDVLAGVFIMIEDQFGLGDVVDVGEAMGEVVQVGLRVTQLRDVHGVLWFVPNGEIRRVGNHSQLWSRTVLDIEVAYGTDMELAMSVIKSALDSIWREGSADAAVVAEPEVLGIQNFGQIAISIRAMLTTEPSQQWAVARLARARIKAAFDEVGIEIPHLQRLVVQPDPGTGPLGTGPPENEPPA